MHTNTDEHVIPFHNQQQTFSTSLVPCMSCTMSCHVPCHVLYHVMSCTMSCLVPYHVLYHVVSCTMSCLVPCHILYHVMSCTMPCLVPCHVLYTISCLLLNQESNRWPVPSHAGSAPILLGHWYGIHGFRCRIIYWWFNYCSLHIKPHNFHSSLNITVSSIRQEVYDANTTTEREHPCKPYGLCNLDFVWIKKLLGFI